ncbi:hypothetical protein GGR52DRAFT_571939 [Hypoxylon sp. FL1284]|nr:hypothetical protein GGR52DRAFT_571939 [Hypoxylon sp. FL1284]
MNVQLGPMKEPAAGMADSAGNEDPTELERSSDGEAGTDVKRGTNTDEDASSEDDDSSASQTASEISQESSVSSPEQPKTLMIYLAGLISEHNKVVDPEGQVAKFYFRADRIFGEKGSVDNLDNIAEELLDFALSTWENADADLSCYSLAFTAPDFGGLIVKEALSRTAVNDKYRPIYARTHILVFFGTPHQASPEWSWGQTTLSIIEDSYRCILGPWLLDRVHQLSGWLERSASDFKKIMAKFRIVNFFQDLAESSPEVVVSDPSHPFHVSFQIPIG